MKGNIVKMVQELKYICIDGVGGFYQYCNAIKKKLRNKVSSELEGFRRSKQTFLKGNVVGMVQEHKKGQLLTYYGRSLWVLTSLLLIQIVNKHTNAVSSKLEGFRRPKQAHIKGNRVKIVQELKNAYIFRLVCIDGVGGLYQFF